MKPMHIAMALLSAAMFFVLAGVFMGVQLELDGTKLVVDTASEIRWQWVFIGTAVVFFFQLVRPAFQKGLKSVSGPKFILPAIDGSTVKQKLFLVALLVLAVAWPFMVSRGTVDIATLTMIYIILGLGLNVVVGLSGLLVLGYGGFYAIGAYTFALLNHYYGLGFWTCLPIAGLMAAAAGFRCCVCAVTIWRSLPSGSAKLCAYCCSITPKLPADRTVSVRFRNRRSSDSSSAVPPAKAAGTRSVISLA